MFHLKTMVFEGIQNLPLFAAQEQGFFSANGLDVEIAFAPNSQILRDGLAAGEHHIAHTAVDNALAMIDQAGHDVAVILGGDSGFNALLCQPDIASIADLRGRLVLVDAPNTAFALVLYRLLELNGLKKSDYRIEPVGATPFRLKRMLEDKAAAASIMNLPYRLNAVQADLRLMCEATDQIGPYLATAGFIMRRWGQDNRDVVIRYIRAYVQGLRFALDERNRDPVLTLASERLGLDKSIAKLAYDMATSPGGISPDAELDLIGIRNVIDLRARLEGEGSRNRLDEQKILDLSYHRQALADLGSDASVAVSSGS